MARANVVESDFRDWTTAGVSWRATFRTSLGGECLEERLPKTRRLANVTENDFCADFGLRELQVDDAVRAWVSEYWLLLARVEARRAQAA